jgi:hypothetical protein
MSYDAYKQTITDAPNSYQHKHGQTKISARRQMARLPSSPIGSTTSETYARVMPLNLDARPNLSYRRDSAGV